MPVEVKYPNFWRAVDWGKKEFKDFFSEVSNYCIFTFPPTLEVLLIFYFDDMQWREVHVFASNFYYGQGRSGKSIPAYRDAGQSNAPYRIPDPPPRTFEGMLDLRTDHPEGWLKEFKKQTYYGKMKKAYEGFAARLAGRKKTESIEELIEEDLSVMKYFK
jgi:hypothetical protein